MKCLQNKRDSISIVRRLSFTIPCVLGICLSFPLNSSFGQAGAVTFGAFLEAGLGKLQQLIAQAQEAGRVAEIEAALQAESVITQAQVAYKDSLETTVDVLDERADESVYRNRHIT